MKRIIINASTNKQRYEIRWTVNGHLHVLKASNSKEYAIESAYKQVDLIFEDASLSDEDKFEALENTYIIDTLTNECVMDLNLERYMDKLMDELDV